MPESITITDNRTGASQEIEIVNGGVAASSFSKLLPGIWFYDPGFMSTAACESAITYLDGDAGELRYRGIPIEQLAEKSNYLEVAYLLLNGELPTSMCPRPAVASSNPRPVPLPAELPPPRGERDGRRRWAYSKVPQISCGTAH